MPNLEEQKKLLNQVIMNRLTVRQLDDEIMALTGKKPQEEQPIEHQNKSILEEHINKMENDIVANAQQPQEQTPVSVNTNQQEPQIATIPNEIKEKQPEISTPKQNIFDILRQESTQDTAIEQPSNPKANINTDTQNQQLNINKQPTQTEQSINIPTIMEAQPQEIKTSQEQTPASVNNNQPEPQVVTMPNELKEEQPSYNQVYDLRFAINNVRQAVQNTEKFGFNIDVQEFDLDNVYQIIIKIDKNKF